MTREGGEFLSVFIRGLNYLRAKNIFPPPRHPGNLQAGVQKYLKAYGCLIKNFRHDKKRNPRRERDGLESLRGER